MKTWLHNRLSFPDVVVLVGGLGVIALTTLPGNFPLMSHIFEFIAWIRFGDKIGHLALFGGLTLVLWYGLNTWMRFILALPTAMLFALSIGTATEIMQWWIRQRSASLSDMLANWLGVFAAGFVISYGYNLYLTLRRPDDIPLSSILEDV